MKTFAKTQLVIGLVYSLLLVSPFASKAAYGGLALNGANQYVTFGVASGLGVTNFTLELWFKWDGSGQAASTGSGGVTAIPLIAKCYGEADNSNVDGNYFLGIQGGVLAADLEEGSTGSNPGLNHPVVGVTYITPNTWHHAAATFDGSYWRLYLDGVLDTTSSYVGQPPRWDSLQYAALGSALNSSGTPNGYFSGVMDEARIWNYPRSAAQIAGTKNVQLATAPGLIGRWGLNETEGTVAYDLTGRGNNGTLVNNPIWTNGFSFTNFVAFNDHAPGIIGSQTSPNATTIDCSAAGSGYLRNIVNGAVLNARMTVTVSGTGLTTGTTVGVPAPGTPLANAFNGNVYFGTPVTTPPNPAVQVPRTATITYTFSGLDPSQRYTFKGGTVRGSPGDAQGSTYNYTNRWSLMNLAGVAGATANHQQGARSRWGYMDATRMTDGSLTGYQVAMNFGVNTNGDMVQWDNIDPGSDGIFSVTCSQYYNAANPIAPGYGTDSAACWANSSAYGFGLTGISLTENAQGESVAGPPVVNITSPTNTSAILAPTNLPIQAAATSMSGIARVEFFQGATKLGQATSSPFVITWTNVPVGNYTLKTIATDFAGLSATSSVVNISVNTNQLPTVALIAPADNSVLNVPASITLQSTAADSDGTIAKVEFYEGTTKLGEDATAPYTMAWNSSTPGDYTFTAVATDNRGASVTSAPVHLAIVNPLLFGGLYFQGFNQYVTLGPAAGLGASNFTLEVWFKWNGDGVTASTGGGGVNAIPLIAKCAAEVDNSNNQDGNYFLGIESGMLAADFEEGATGASPGLNHPIRGMTQITTGVWHHAAVTYDGASWALYLDGNLERAGYVGQPPRWDSIQHAALGSALNSAGTPSGYFSGVLDEARIWNYARSAGQIMGLKNSQISSADGLIGRWGLDESVGALAHDSSGHGINGTLTNGPVWTYGYPFTTGPSVWLTMPANGADFAAGSHITLNAQAIDTNASIVKVEFFTGATKVGQATGSPYSCVWSNAPAGFYSITAVLTDSTPLSVTSAPVAIAIYGESGNPPPSVALMTPVEGASYSSAEAIPLAATASDFDGVSLVEFFANDIKIGESSTPPYTFNWSGAVTGSCALTALATDTKGNAAFSAPINITVYYPLTNTVTLVPTNAWYSLFKGVAEASSPANAWRAVGFNDSGWSNSQAPFYYDTAPGGSGDTYYGNTQLSDMPGSSGYLTIYLRHKFVVNNPDVLTQLILKAKYDDGFVAWLNGVEVFRTPTIQSAAGMEVPYTYDSTLVTSANESPNGPFVTNIIAVPTSVLVPGTNLLTIHACNSALSSSDFLIDFELQADMLDDSIAPPAVASTIPPAGELGALNSILVVFSKAVQNVDASDLLINAVPATGVSGSSNQWTFTFLQPSYGVINITWATNHGISDLDSLAKPFNAAAIGATWQYLLLSPNAPTILTEQPADGATVSSFTSITVRFSENVINVDASDLLINGIPATSVSGSGNLYTFTFPQPAYGAVNITWAANHGITDLEVPPNPFNTATWHYFLVDQTAPVVTSRTPVADSALTSLSQIQVTFSEAVKNVNASDLLINGVAATNMTGSGASYTFNFARTTAPIVHVTWAANHGITDLAAIANPFNATASGATWDYYIPDVTAPIVATIYPPPVVAVRSMASVQVTFSEPVAGVSASSLLMNGQPALNVSGSGVGPYRFTFAEPAAGLVQMAWAPAQQIVDLATVPNSFAGGSWSNVFNPSLTVPYAVPHVVHISLDGAGAYYIEQYLNQVNMPTYQKLRAKGASTLNARTDYDYTITLPNHTCMFTGRPVLQPSGWDADTHSGLTTDSDTGTTVHDPAQSNPDVPYKYSLFDVAHDNGFSTGFLYSKQSLTLFARSWNADSGAADAIGDDNGRNKFDFVFNSTPSGSSYGPTAPVVDQFLQYIQSGTLWGYTFLHFDDGDATGHASGWGSSNYRQAITNTDYQIGRVLDAIQSNPVYSNTTILIVTADHGGGDPTTSHTVASSYVNYRVPLFVFGPGIPAGVDLYSLMANRADPGTNRYSYSDSSVLQPLRTGDTGNLGLHFLGLPSIPGSSMIPEFAENVALTVVRTGNTVNVTWPASAAGKLKASASLGQDANWQTITTNITTQNGLKTYSYTPAPGAPVLFFRIQK
jgi:hypothetical protein